MNSSRDPQSSLDKEEPETRQHAQKVSAHKKTALFIILLFTGLILFIQREAIVTIDCTPEIIAQKPDVIMLGAWWCRYCHKAKEYFQQNNIHYCEYDMESTARGKQLYRQYGGGLPVLLIGKYQLNGFDEEQVEQVLALLKQ